MSLIEDVARLKGLEKKATPRMWIKAEQLEYDAEYDTADHLVGGPTGRTEYDRDTGVFTTHNADPDEIYDDSIICRPDVEDDADLIAELRNAAPDLLGVMGAFQEGDAAILSEMLQGHIDFEEEFPDENPGWTDLLSRLTNAACKMEAKQE